MSIVDELPVERRAVQARYRKEIAGLDWDRMLLQLSRGGATQRQIAELLGVSQPAICKLLAHKVDVPEPLAGFSSATPMEACKRYAAGEITRGQLVDELVAFPYPMLDRDPYDDVTPDPPGAWSEVEAAARRKLIERDIYEEVFFRRHRARNGR